MEFKAIVLKKERGSPIENKIFVNYAVKERNESDLHRLAKIHTDLMYDDNCFIDYNFLFQHNRAIFRYMIDIKKIQVLDIFYLN